MTFDTASELADFGIAKSELTFLRPDSFDVTPYLDLIPSIRQSVKAEEIWPEAVINGPFGPTAYVVRSDQLSIHPEVRNNQLLRLQKRLTSRSIGTMLVIVSRGKIGVLSLNSRNAKGLVTEIVAEQSAHTFFRELAAGSLPSKLNGIDGWRQADRTIAGDFASLIVLAVRRLNEFITQEEALLLVTRTVIIRLLLERGIIAPTIRQEFLKGAPFSTPSLARRANQWLDEQFKGEILQLGWWSYNVLFPHSTGYFGREQSGLYGVLAEIFLPNDTMSLNWSEIDFSSIRPIIVAEAFDRAISELKQPLSTRKTTHYTPAAVANFMVEESIPMNATLKPCILTTSTDCGQVLIAALERMVTREWDCNGKRPSGLEIQQLISTKMRGLSSDIWRRHIAAAILSFAALDLSPEAYPLSSSKFPSPLNTVFPLHPIKDKFDVVLGDHAKDHDYGRSAFKHAISMTEIRGRLSLCIGNRVIRSPRMRLPAFLRNQIRLVGVVTNIIRTDRKSPADIIFIDNTPPDLASEFWVSSPFEHRLSLPQTPSWIDASRTYPVSQALAESIPGLLAALPTMNILESGVLVRIWRKLATPPDTLVLEDPTLVAFCVSLISESVVGKFVNTVLGGSISAGIKLPCTNLLSLSDSTRIRASYLNSCEPTENDQCVALVERLCALDSADFEIMSNRLAGTQRQMLSPQDFSLELMKRLEPFWEKDAIRVSSITNSSSSIHLFTILNCRVGQNSDLDWSSACEKIADAPVSSVITIPAQKGCLLLGISESRLDSSSTWIIALDILRNHTNHLDEKILWPND